MRQKKVLFLGLDPEPFSYLGDLFHCPVIQIVPKEVDASAFSNLKKTSHLIFTSKQAVLLFFKILEEQMLTLPSCRIIAVGKGTAGELAQRTVSADFIAQKEQAEGIIEILETVSPSFCFWPRSSGARSLITDYLKARGVAFQAPVIYDTVARVDMSIPNLNEFDAVFFTSPSTVKHFFSIFKTVPKRLQLMAIGPVTQKHLSLYSNSESNSRYC